MNAVNGFPRRAMLALAVTAGLVAIAPASAQQASNQRLIVHFHDNVAGAAAGQEIKQTVGAAMTRAGIASAGGQRLAANGVRAVRRLGTGAELLQLPAPLASADMQRLVAEMAADPAVRYVEPDTLQYAQQVQAPAPFQPNDPYYRSHQWNLHDPVGGVNAPAAWALSRGEGVVVAVIDTGILPEHPDLDPARLLPGYDFISDTFKSRRDTAGPAPGALDLGDWSAVANECGDNLPPQPSSWHGTHVAATIGEATDNAVGLAGLAPASTILPVRVLGRCGGWTSDIIDGLTWASGGSVPGVPANPNPADILNLSLGGGFACPRSYQEAIDAAVARGAVVVVAAGNSAVDVAEGSPSSCRNIINVAATGASGAAASYSNFGAGVDLAAPGGDQKGDRARGYVWQAASNGQTTPTSGAYDYIGKVGTSMAAPHVAATAALVQSARVAAGRLPLAPERMEALLVSTARPFPLPPSAVKPIGMGIVDAAAAVRLALSDSCDVAREGCVPSTTLVPGVPASGQAGGATGNYFSFVAQAGKPLRVATYGGKGEVALYVRRGAAPQADRYDARSTRIGTHEGVLIARPAADTYFVWLAGGPSFEGVTVVVRQ